jgi:hypothetical protein
MLNRSVGYLIEDAEHQVLLTESISANDSIGCSTCIPKFAIVKMDILQPAYAAPVVSALGTAPVGVSLGGGAAIWNGQSLSDLKTWNGQSLSDLKTAT